MTQLPYARAKRLRLARAFACLVLICAALHMSLASAQQADHKTEVYIPSYLGIRIINDAGAARGSPAVNFDYTSDVSAYTDAYKGPGYIGASEVTDFADVQVSVRTGFAFPLWYVTAQASPLAYEGSQGGAGLTLGDIEVVRGSVSGLNQGAVVGGLGRVFDAWTLAVNPQPVAYSFIGTYGWRSLGFNGLDYRVAVDGDEDPGEYSTTVTYAIFYP